MNKIKCYRIINGKMPDNETLSKLEDIFGVDSEVFIMPTPICDKYMIDVHF